jgi:hypothetical protein
MGMGTSGSTKAGFDFRSNCPTGARTLQMIVNGIASKAVCTTLNN